MTGFYITPAGLQELKNYKYQGGQYTHGDKCMQPFWNWFVELIPMVRTETHLLFVHIQLAATHQTMYLTNPICLFFC